MLEDLNQRLARCTEEMARLEKQERMVASLSQEVREAQALVAKLRRQAAKEEQDVERLEGMSLTALFHSMLGSKDEQLRKERQEALAAQLKLDEASRRLEALEREAATAQSELQRYQGARARYTALMQEKESTIASSAGQGSTELFRFSEREQAAQWQLQQLDEALTAGRRAEHALSSVVDSLQSAQGWGTWDMLGGGLIATAIKHSRIDDAKSQVHHAQQALVTFQRELKDVALDLNIGQVGVDGFTKFADYFFDGLITDWIVQSRINQSLEGVRRNQSQVRSLLNLVAQRRSAAEAELAAVRQERAAFVERF